MAATAAVGYVRRKPYPIAKVKRFEEYAMLLSEYRYAILSDITNIPAQVLHEMRRKLRERGAVLKVIKNRLFAKALENSPKKLPSALCELLSGQNAVIFTNENPFSLVTTLKKEYKMTRAARPGDIATSEIVIPAGNTGIAPGPTMSLFSKLKIPIRVQEGTIWVTADTVIAKKGDVVTPELAELLGKLGLKPIEVTIPIKAVVIDGRAVKLEEVELEPEAYVNYITDAHKKAVNLALNACLPVPDVLGLLIARARVEAEALATALALPLPGVIERLVARAHVEATVLLNELRQRNPSI